MTIWRSLFRPARATRPREVLIGKDYSTSMNNATFRLELCEALTFCVRNFHHVYWIVYSSYKSAFFLVAFSIVRCALFRRLANINLFAKISKLSINLAKWILLNTFVGSEQVPFIYLALRTLSRS